MHFPAALGSRCHLSGCGEAQQAVLCDVSSVLSTLFMSAAWCSRLLPVGRAGTLDSSLVLLFLFAVLGTNPRVSDILDKHLLLSRMPGP